MQGFNAKLPVNVGMKHGHIAEPDNPLGMFAKFPITKLVDDPYVALPTSGTHDGPDLIVVQHVLKIFAALFVGTGKLAVAAENIGAEHYLQFMSLEKTDGRVHLFKGDAASRGNNTDLVAFFQIGWLDHGVKVYKKRDM